MEITGRGQRASVMPGRVGELEMGGVPKVLPGVKVSEPDPTGHGSEMLGTGWSKQFELGLLGGTFST